MHSNRLKSLLEPVISDSRTKLNQKYFNWYISLISRYLDCVSTGYTEKHHILPRSLGGNNDPENLVILPARAHYVAHLILAKATSHPKMIGALHRMVHSQKSYMNSGRDYFISSCVYAYLQEAQAKVVGDYSCNTVTARNLETGVVSRIPIDEFKLHKGTKYVGVRAGMKDSKEVRKRKSIASTKMAKTRKRRVYDHRTISLQVTKWKYITPLGFCETFEDFQKLYPSFTKNSQLVLKDDHIITKSFIYHHPEFSISDLGKTLFELGIKRINMKEK